MYLVKFKSVVDYNGLELEPGTYLMENVNAGQCLMMHGPEVEIIPWEESLFDSEVDYEGQRILLIRPGGFGDLLFLTPLMAEIKRRWPGCFLGVACARRCAPVLEENPHVDEVLVYPIAMRRVHEFQAVVCFENVLEFSEAGRTIPAMDVFAGQMKLTLTDRRMTLDLREHELKDVARRLPRSARRRVGIQLFSSSPVRNYPRFAEVIYLLGQKSCEVVVFAAPGQSVVKSNYAEVINTHDLVPPFTFRESCAAMLSCDVVIAPDSSLTHAAAALGVPCVALYGSFPWELRVKVQTGIPMVALTGKLACSPCFHHGRPGNPMPKHCPGREEHRCEALNEIEPRRVVAKALELAEAFANREDRKGAKAL